MNIRTLPRCAKCAIFATDYADLTQQELVIELTAYLAKKLEGLRPEEASAARVLRDLVRNQRLG